MVTTIEEAVAGAERVGYPVLVRPSYVLGGRAMVIAYDADAVSRYMKGSGGVLTGTPRTGRPLSRGCSGS